MANCIKCGKELVGSRVFCDECLNVMQKYPVPAGTPLNILHRETVPKKQPPKKKIISAEEQILRLRRLVRAMTAVLAIAILLMGAMLAILIQEWREPNPSVEETKGQNYSTQSSTTPVGTP